MPHLNHRRGDTRARENLGSRGCDGAGWYANPRRDPWYDGEARLTRGELNAKLRQEEEIRDMHEHYEEEE